MTLRPSLLFRWVAPVMFLGAGGVLLATAYKNLASGGFSDAWLVGLFAVVWIGLAAYTQLAYIRADDSTVVFGPKMLARSSFPRQEIALIRATHSPFMRRTLFLRPDGSKLYGTPGWFWGRAGLQSLADYLGVPFEG